MSDPGFTPATDAQIALALAQADGALAAAGHYLDPADRAASDAEIPAAMRGEQSFDDAVAAGLARITGKDPA
ncbi:MULTISPECIES: hypothetical protein [Mycobacteriales]|uniref:Antitoxin VbhA domain-containing protein n=1 Tax=Gordonia amicalis TaxID=89053 RepID=A0AAE4U891_9ACTN|nr:MULTISPECIES: hypothetical protein [Mycobacteriales]KHJ71268.1 hypothetical protein QR64_18110 [Rhodococcus sp. Chr-9]MDV6312121.1 hypothetical protein [Gordonia amicalis]HNP55916.1 hypothetical protein [Gordonia sp. (in: high G+C Gram-positive bacteria)]HRC51975.1 hypothetical protein [Gordonia sp. (in: high G+C Gram-positive bacteria)]